MPLPGSATWADVMGALATARTDVQDAIDTALLGPSPPSVLSPGYLALGYGDATVQHRTRVRLCFGADPYDISQMENEAVNWATGLAYALNTTQTIDTWYSYNGDGDLVASTLLPAAVTGLNTLNTLESRSFTECLTGHGAATATHPDAGEARCRIFPFREELPSAGDKYRILASYAPLLPLAYVLAVSPRIWADFFGQKAGIRGHAPIQSNAFAQNHKGW